MAIRSSAVDANDASELVESVGTKLQDRVSGYLPKEACSTIGRALKLAAEAHAGQTRAGGEPYVVHVIETARILADLRCDGDVIAAALLHDVPEDTSITLDALRKEFNSEVAKLVDGVTKLTTIRFDAIDTLAYSTDSPAQHSPAHSNQAENLRKLMLAMADDIRVVLIKMADRLHNMRTLDALAIDRRRRIAQETMDIYAPLAARLGIGQLKWQLEDLAFRHMNPAAYRRISRLLVTRRGVRERYIKEAARGLKQELDQAGLKCQVVGRPKHLYSIFQKSERTGLQATQLHDLNGLRVIAEGQYTDCYSVLGIVHATWKPIPTPVGGTGFRDYIAMPKENGYRALHTTVLGPQAKALEVQIKTVEMHYEAEFGVASHWRYKEGRTGDEKFDRQITSIRRQLEAQQEISVGAVEFVESLKSDVLRDQVYVFTPKGEIRELPRGATPIDFAYRIHTDIGHQCVGCRVNGRLVPLDYQLQNGDVVEIVTSKRPKEPSRDWLNASLNYVKTAHAREKIRQWFRRQLREESLARGREQIEKALSRMSISTNRLDEVLPTFRLEKLDELYIALGTGEISTHAIVAKLLTAESTDDDNLKVGGEAPRELAGQGIQVLGVGGLLTRLSRCCDPVPGEKIIGYITRGRGVTVHRSNCPNVHSSVEADRLIGVEWGNTRQQVFPISIRIEAWDRPGLLRDVSAVVAEDHINMSSADVGTRPDSTAIIRATLDVSSIAQLGRVMSRLEGVRSVLNISRDTPERKSAAEKG